MRLLSVLSAVLGLLLSACSTCYNDRFCQELIGLSSIQVVSLVGVPSACYEQGDIKVMEWVYNGTYRSDWIVTGRHDVWMHPHGFMYSAYVSPTVGVDTVPRVAMLRLTLEKDRVTSYTYQFNGNDMCNYFVPESFIERYKIEDKARRR